MNRDERGQENLQDLADRRNNEADEKRAERTRGASNGESAGGDQQDVPGGAYNVPSGLADEVSEEPAADGQRTKR